MGFRFLHTADLHLDSPLKALALRDEDLAREVGVATRTTLSRIVSLAISECVDFVLFAGDIWDREYSSTKTPRFLKQELLRLEQAGIRSFIIRGNHDAEARQTGELDPPASSHVFGGRAATQIMDIRGHHIAIHGLSFREAHAPESLLPRYPAPVQGAFNIGMMHTSLNGSAGHDPYAPCSVADLASHGYDYWALGHIHRRSVHVVGQAHIVMPGAPQGRDIGEAGPGTVTIGQVSDEGQFTMVEHSVAALRFDRLAIDLTGVEQWPEVLSRLEDSLRDQGQRPRPEDHLVLRLTLSGATPLAWRVTRDLDRLTQEAQAMSASLPSTWIDKLELQLSDTAPPISQLPEDLVRLVSQELPQDQGLQGMLDRIAAEFLDDLPPELRGDFGQDEDARAALLRELQAEGTAALLTRLSTEEGR